MAKKVSGRGGPTYDRVPGPEMQALLRKGGFLAPLLAPRAIDGVELEAHLRPGDEVHVCCGLTCLVKARPEGKDSIRVETHATYAGQPCAEGLFRPGRCRPTDKGQYVLDVWTVGDAGFRGALDAFLTKVDVTPAQKKEGAVHARWSRIRAPWVPFDKEVALSYPSVVERQRHLAAVFRQSVEGAREELTELAARDHWSLPPTPKDRLKLDQIAVDLTGNLVLLEVKDTVSAKPSEVYYAPFQILQNVWEWHTTLDAVRDSVQKLYDVRVKLDMTPAGAPAMTGGVRPVVGFGDDRRSLKVRERYAEALRIAKAHLPRAVPAIETWMLADGGEPLRLD